MDDYNVYSHPENGNPESLKQPAPENAFENVPASDAEPLPEQDPSASGEYHFTGSDLFERNQYAESRTNAQAPRQQPQQPPYGAYPPPYGYAPYGAPSANEPPRYAYPSPDEKTPDFEIELGPEVEVRKKKKNRTGKILLALVAVIAVVVGIFLVKNVIEKRGTVPQAPGENVTGEAIENVDKVETKNTPLVEVTVGADQTLDPTEIYKKILPSSVGILVYSKSSHELLSEGSGVIFQEDNDGEYTYIVTCAHVVKGANQNIMVQLSSDEREIPAQVVGYDSRTDIGVIRIKESGLTAIEIGDSDKLVVGETVYAIGNPGGTEFAFTFTNGIVTALDRPVSSSSTGYTMECIQHNVAINPGNSGGALVNRFGQLIGINSMKIVAADYEGMGFAVPSSVFVEIVNEIMEKGYVSSRPKIGISYLKASDEQAYAMFVAIKNLPAGSIVVADVSKDSDFYGDLQKGDLVTAINGKDLDSAADLQTFVENMQVGNTVTLHVVRINRDYSYTEQDITGKLVEDKETMEDETEEPETSIFDGYFDDGDGGSDYGFDDFYDRFFGGQQ